MKPKKKFLSKPRTMFQTVFTGSLLCILFLTLTAILSISYFSYQNMVDEKGKSRIDVLQQLSDSNMVNRTNMVNAMNMVSADFHDLLTAPRSAETDKTIAAKLAETGALFDRLGMDLTIDIVMNDKRTFATKDDSETLMALKNTYWYIRHYSGVVETSWNLRFPQSNDSNDYGFSYGQTVYNADGKSVGLILITSMHEVLFRSLQKHLVSGSTIYVLDANGIIISHTNPQRVGNWMANMSDFEQTVGYNSYHLIRRGTQTIMQANYYDVDSGWTYVEEQDASDLMQSSFHMIRNCVLLLSLGALLALLVAYKNTKKAISMITDFSHRISTMSDVQTQLPVHDDYEEIRVLGTTFNAMIRRIEELILDIQAREKERQRTEYDFLQAQLSPHFLHNTLLAIKTLLHMGETEKAALMMEKFIELIHIPSTPEIRFVTLENELHLVQNLVQIMNYRTDKDVLFFDQVPQALRGEIVPQMLLQPIIGNAFFHGFAERESGCEITVTAGLQDQLLCLCVQDNGEGIPPERLREINGDDYTPGPDHHGVGIRNVRKRLQLIYGGRSNVQIKSAPGEGTTIILQIDHYDNPTASGHFSQNP